MTASLQFCFGVLAPCGSWSSPLHLSPQIPDQSQTSDAAAGLPESVPCVLDPYEYRVDLCNESCLSVRLASQLAGRLCSVAKTLTLDMTRKLFNKFCHTCHAHRRY